jgi:predicted MFS family arabinose efflux permease
LGRNFRLYATGQAVSVVGDRIAVITLVFLVIRLSNSYAPALALFYVCRVLPTLIGGLLVGVVVDHFDRRKLMLSCDLGRAALLAMVPALSGLSLGTLYPLVIALYAFTLLFDTSAAAAVPDVVPDLRLMTANSILGGIKNCADIAYGAGGALVYFLGLRAPLYIDAGTFAFSAAMIYGMQIPRQGPKRPLDVPEAVARVRAGVRFIAGHPFLKWSVLTFAIAPAAGGLEYVLSPLYADHDLGQSAWLVGPLHEGVVRFSVLEVVLGLGALTGSILAPRLGRRWPRGRLFGLGLVGTGLPLTLLAATTNFYVAALLIAFSTAWFSIFIISGITLSQSLTPTELRGRVTAARVTVTNCALLLGSALGGFLLLVTSVRVLWIVDGLVVCASSLLVWLHKDVRNQR